MYPTNNAALVKRELLVRMIRLMLADRLPEEIDRIPFEITGEGYQPVRCCVHHDRAILRTRLIAALGFSVEDESDPARPLAELAHAALERRTLSEPILTVIHEACNACIKAQYLVTNACQGCLARPCKMNCPRAAIDIVGGKAVIETGRCINCGICQRACPYHAIIEVPIPCEQACPVKAISKDADGKERIDYSKCIYCGNCMRACPFGAVADKSQLIDVLRQARRGRKLAALVAPAIIGQFRASAGQLATALRKAGFAEVHEVAVGADVTAAREARELTERIERQEPFMTTSCCPAYVQAVHKHIPALAAHVSETRSPMHYTAELVAEEHPDLLRVFIGPCLAKRKEGLDDPLIDAVLSAEELAALFVAMGIEVGECAEAPFEKSSTPEGRGFPLSGGVAAAVCSRLPPGVTVDTELVDGLDAKRMKHLAGLSASPSATRLVEVMACSGGCVSGPSTLANPRLAASQIRRHMQGS
jgi:[FeFe] hydrogenase (group B1/B3)